MEDRILTGIKRSIKYTDPLFPFEIIHINEPANNMECCHWHDGYELSYVVKGNGKYEIEDKKFEVEAGDLIIINNIERHRVTYNTNNPLYENVIHFDPKLIWSKENSIFDFYYLKLFAYNKAIFKNKVEICEESKTEVSNLLSEIVSEYLQKQNCYKLMIKSKLLTLITILIRNCNMQLISEEILVTKRNNIERLEKILTYIAENFNAPIDMSSTAKKFFMNPSYFSDYFKKNVGLSFLDYLSKIRINELIKMISEGKFSLTEIIFMVGFNNTASFYNSFKKHMGMNFKEFRKTK